MLCGAGRDQDYTESLRRESRDLPVTWVPRRADVGSLLGAADLVVLPSLAFETQGLIVMEAMACGTPAIASDVGGLPETLTAFPDHLVPPGDTVALAEAISRVVGWRKHSPDLGRRSRQWVADHLAMAHSITAVSTLLGGLAP